MLCYRDRTYCSFYKDCAKAKDCSRPLTPDVEAAAKAINLPICRYVNKPDCHVPDNDGVTYEKQN